MFKRILIVCTGNICRSPMAEALLAARRPEARVESAGSAALVGHAADPLAIEVMAARGVDISAHRARQATSALMAEQELILVLDRTHLDWINARYPQLRGRVHKLMRWRGDADVADPYRRPLAAFQQACADIEQGVDDWIKRLGR